MTPNNSLQRAAEFWTLGVNQRTPLVWDMRKILLLIVIVATSKSLAREAVQQPPDWDPERFAVQNFVTMFEDDIPGSRSRAAIGLSSLYTDNGARPHAILHVLESNIEALLESLNDKAVRYQSAELLGARLVNISGERQPVFQPGVCLASDDLWPTYTTWMKRIAESSADVGLKGLIEEAIGNVAKCIHRY